MSTEILHNAISTSLSLIGLTILIFWGLRTLAEDWFRDNMFAVRDRLFDEASTGVISFDHPAYGMLRQTMNGYIRFCHRLSLLYVIISVALIGNVKRDEKLFEQNWKKVTENISPDSRQKLESCRREMELLVISYLIISSPFIAVVLFIVLLLGFALREVGSLRRKFILQWAKQIRQSERLQPILSEIDDTAYVVGVM